MREADEIVLTDGTIVLRPWRLEDAPAVLAACQDPLIARFVPIPQPYTEAHARDFVQRQPTEDERGFAIADASNDEILGSIGRHGPYGHRVGFGYWLAPAARGRGIATRALRLLVDWTARTTDAIVFELFTDPKNEASGRVALRAGFEREGIRRAWYLDRTGRPRDVVFYVIVRARAHEGARGPFEEATT